MTCKPAGAIRGYRAVVDPAAVGLGFEVLVFATAVRPEAVTDFDAALADIPQVIETQRLFGEAVSARRPSGLPETQP